MVVLLLLLRIGSSIMKKRTVKALEICLVCCCSPCGTNCPYGFFDAIFLIVLVVAVAAVVCVFPLLVLSFLLQLSLLSVSYHWLFSLSLVILFVLYNETIKRQVTQQASHMDICSCFP